MRVRRLAGWLPITLLLVAACDDSSGSGGSGQGGTAEQSSSSTTTSTTATSATTTTGSSTTTTGGAGGEASGGGGAGGGPPDPLINGCTLATAEDHSGEENVNLTWTLPHQECTIIDAGSTVTWTGQFNLHPLVGGEVPVTDDASPITLVDASSGATASVTFPDPGVYPYFCTVHQSALQGVIYVQ